eukprot:gene1632-1727_t
MAIRFAGLIQPGYDAPDAFAFVSGIPMYVAGLSYCICYYFNSDILKSYERQSNSHDHNIGNALRTSDLLRLAGETNSSQVDVL